MNLDKIFTIDIGTSFLDKKKLEHKFITQHKWNDKFYKAKEWYVFVPHTGIDCFTPLYDIIFSEIRKIDREINLMSIQGMKDIGGPFSFVLVQNKDRNTFNWHNHFLYQFNSLVQGAQEWHPFKWSTVYYMSMPKGSGGIRFKENDKEVVIQPSEGQLVIFPSSLYHTPDINHNEDWRISINVNVIDQNILMRGNRAIRGDVRDWDFREKI